MKIKTLTCTGSELELVVNTLLIRLKNERHDVTAVQVIPGKTEYKVIITYKEWS